MIITAFDTGITTGIVTVQILEFNHSAHVISHRTVKGSEAHLVADILTCDLVILERLPIIKDSELAIIERNILSRVAVWGKDHKFVAPSEWKPVAEARKWDFPESNSIHERDSYKMLRYWIWKTYKKDLL